MTRNLHAFRSRATCTLAMVFVATGAWSQNEVPFRFQQQVPPDARGPESTCAFAGGLQLPEDTIVLAAGSYAGRRVSFQIDQSGHEATQFDLAVHADKPVALILGAYEPSIWNIGWTPGTRIVAVYATGYHRQVVAGLPKGTPILTPSYDEKSACGYNYLASDKEFAWLNPRSRALFGKEVTRVYPKARAGVIELDESTRPKGEFVTSADSPPSSFRDAKAPLAGTAGLEEAVAKGLVRPVTSADIEAVRDAYREKAARASASGKVDIPPIAGVAGNTPAPIKVPIGSYRSFVVLKQFTYPAGLYGGNLAHFVVPKGVPKPAGNPGHSTVVDLNDIALCTGALCQQ